MISFLFLLVLGLPLNRRAGPYLTGCFCFGALSAVSAVSGAENRDGGNLAATKPGHSAEMSKLLTVAAAGQCTLVQVDPHFSMDFLPCHPLARLIEMCLRNKLTCMFRGCPIKFYSKAGAKIPKLQFFGEFAKKAEQSL